MDNDAPQSPTFAARLEQLFAARTNPNTGRRYTDSEVAAAVGLSKTAVWALRTGQATNPTWETINALARFFGVTPAWFFEQEKTDDDAELRALMADVGVRRIAARAAGLSEPSQRMVIDVLEQIRRLEKQPDVEA